MCLITLSRISFGKQNSLMLISSCILFYFIFCHLSFLGLHPYEFPRLGLESELQLSAYATATATGDPSFVCDLPHSSQQHWILYLFIYLFIYCLLAISWAAPAAHGGSQARGRIGAAATGLRQSHSNAGSELRLPPTPQFTATPAPSPTE